MSLIGLNREKGQVRANFKNIKARRVKTFKKRNLNRKELRRSYTKK